MEYVKKYWWVLLAGLALLFVMSRRSGAAASDVPAYSVATIGGNDNSATENAALQAGLLGSLLNYDLQRSQTEAQGIFATQQLESQERIAKMQSDQAAAMATNAAAQQQYQANLAYQAQVAQYQSQQQQYQMQAQMQQQALNAQRSAQSQNQWMQLLGTLGSSLIPIFAGNLGLGRYGTQPTFPTGTGGFNFNFGNSGGLWAGSGGGAGAGW